MDMGATFNEIRSELSFAAGWGRISSGWDDDADPGKKGDAIDSCIRYGLRKFLTGTIAPGTRKVYEWSFLRKQYKFLTVADQTDYPLPEDFGSPDGDLTYTQDFFSPVPFITDGRLLAMQSSQPTATGVVQFAAIRFLPSQGAVPQAQHLLLFPTPTGAWTLLLSYQINPDLLSERSQVPAGGPAYARAILYACLSELATRIGPPNPQYEQEYQAALLAAISVDSRVRAGSLGYNGDGERIARAWDPGGPEFTVAYDGQIYDNT